jgi:hypothetical protein
MAEMTSGVRSASEHRTMVALNSGLVQHRGMRGRDTEVRYAAFISYSHAGDAEIASALQSGLKKWRPHFFGLYLDGNLVASSTAANTATSTAWSIFRFGWSFSTSQDFNGDIALIACLASSWTPAMIRRWHADPFGFLRPWNEVPAIMGSAPPAAPPSSSTGVVTFLMG